MKVNTYFKAYASVTMTVELSQEDLEDLAKDLDTSVENLADYDIIDLASEKASEQGFGGLCAQCAGWDQKWSQDIGDWESEDDAGMITER